MDSPFTTAASGPSRALIDDVGGSADPPLAILKVDLLTVSSEPADGEEGAEGMGSTLI